MENKEKCSIYEPQIKKFLKEYFFFLLKFSNIKKYCLNLFHVRAQRLLKFVLDKYIMENEQDSYCKISR